MALEAGVMAVTVDFAKDLKDRDWIGKQDPYVIITCGAQTFRSRTAIDGGRNPVWHETFKFNVINENAAHITFMDEDNGKKDDFIGECEVVFAKARMNGSDEVQVPVQAKKNKQRGFISLRLAFTPNSAVKPHAPPSTTPCASPAPIPMPPAPSPVPIPVPAPTPAAPVPHYYPAPPTHTPLATPPTAPPAPAPAPASAPLPPQPLHAFQQPVMAPAPVMMPPPAPTPMTPIASPSPPPPAPMPPAPVVPTPAPTPAVHAPVASSSASSSGVLEAGVMAVTVEYAQGLKDKDWIGKQDPYVIIKCGAQTFRSRTAKDGGRNPVWGETFKFNVINENGAEIRIMDEDNGIKDDFIGECQVSFARAREYGQDVLQVPVISKKQKQRGYVSLKIVFTPNKALKPDAAPAAAAAPHPTPAPAPVAAAPLPQQPQLVAAAPPMMAGHMAQMPQMPGAYAMPAMPMAYVAVPIIAMPNPFPAATGSQ